MDTQIRIEYPRKKVHPFFETPPDVLYAPTVGKAAEMIKQVLELGNGLPKGVERVNADGEVEQEYDVNVNVFLAPRPQSQEG